MSNTLEGAVSLLTKFKFPVTIEPLVFFYTIAGGLIEIIRSNLLIEKICQEKLNYTDVVCSNLTELDDIQKIVLENVSEYEALYSSLSFVPKILYALLAGTWSDMHGRKALLGFSIFGQILASISYGLNFFFLKGLPWQFLLLELLNDLSGSYVAYYLAVYSYITDITEEDARTYRLAIVDGVDYVSTSIGARISAPIFLGVGYYGVFGLSAGTCVLGLLYLIFFIRESLDKTDEGVKTLEVSLTSSCTQTDYGSQQPLEPPEDSNNPESEVEMREVWGWIKTSFGFVFESLQTVIKPRRGPRRLILLLGIFNFACYIFTYNGTEGSHRYYFAQRKYGWTEQEMSTYLFDYRIGYMVSLWLLIPLMTKVLVMSDTTIAIIACITSSVGFILPAVTNMSDYENPANTEWFRSGSFVLNWFTVGSFICMLSPVTTVATRSIISRAIPGTETGRIYSVLALFSAASGSLVESGFQLLYSSTISSFLGSYLLLNAGLLLLTIPVNLGIKWLFRKMEV